MGQKSGKDAPRAVLHRPCVSQSGHREELEWFRRQDRLGLSESGDTLYSTLPQKVRRGGGASIRDGPDRTEPVGQASGRLVDIGIATDHRTDCGPDAFRLISHKV